jgi:hypothetical protein
MIGPGHSCLICIYLVYYPIYLSGSIATSFGSYYRYSKFLLRYLYGRSCQQTHGTYQEPGHTRSPAKKTRDLTVRIRSPVVEIFHARNTMTYSRGVPCIDRIGPWMAWRNPAVFPTIRWNITLWPLNLKHRESRHRFSSINNSSLTAASPDYGIFWTMRCQAGLTRMEGHNPNQKRHGRSTPCLFAFTQASTYVL